MFWDFRFSVWFFSIKPIVICVCIIELTVDLRYAYLSRVKNFEFDYKKHELRVGYVFCD